MDAVLMMLIAWAMDSVSIIRRQGMPTHAGRDLRGRSTDLRKWWLRPRGAVRLCLLPVPVVKVMRSAKVSIRSHVSLTPDSKFQPV